MLFSGYLDEMSKAREHKSPFNRSVAVFLDCCCRRPYESVVRRVHLCAECIGWAGIWADMTLNLDLSGLQRPYLAFRRCRVPRKLGTIRYGPRAPGTFGEDCARRLLIDGRSRKGRHQFACIVSRYKATTAMLKRG